jgi:hypothetical protein
VAPAEASASSVANVTEGAVRAFNVFQDAGQVLGPVLGGLLCAYYGGFANAALAIGAFVCLYGALALSFRVSLTRPAALDGPVVLSAAAVSAEGDTRGERGVTRGLPPAFPTKSENLARRAAAALRRQRRVQRIHGLNELNGLNGYVALVYAYTVRVSTSMAITKEAFEGRRY